MKNTIRIVLYTLIQWTWGIIQNICGGAVFFALYLCDPKRERRYFHGAAVIKWNNLSSGGIGMFIFCGKNTDIYSSPVIAHEYGHTLQSALLGPLYLIVIGLPSVCWAFLPYFKNKRKREKRSYYSFYTERWANRFEEKSLHLPTPE